MLAYVWGWHLALTKADRAIEMPVPPLGPTMHRSTINPPVWTALMVDMMPVSMPPTIIKQSHPGLLTFACFPKSLGGVDCARDSEVLTKSILHAFLCTFARVWGLCLHT